MMRYHGDGDIFIRVSVHTCHTCLGCVSTICILTYLHTCILAYLHTCILASQVAKSLPHWLSYPDVLEVREFIEQPIHVAPLSTTHHHQRDSRELRSASLDHMILLTLFASLGCRYVAFSLGAQSDPWKTSLKQHTTLVITTGAPPQPYAAPPQLYTMAKEHDENEGPHGPLRCDTVRYGAILRAR